ncbi:hypothetical protein A2335_01475 [Candidatus Peregrinibacteria bacterium RIFOXYB2_FULL_32_7]|nr:MAG: hypothetical protein A2335_01475 [Candidatus Peregrinibacteria bacterium RIFOXYB2_FULL_32_7]
MKKFIQITKLLSIALSIILLNQIFAYASDIDLGEAIQDIPSENVLLLDRHILIKIPVLGTMYFLKLKDLGINENLDINISEAKKALEKINSFLPKPQNAYFNFENNEIIITEAQDGFEIDFEKTFEKLQKNLTDFNLKELEIELKKTPADIHQIDLEKYEEELKSKLIPIEINSEKKSWELKPETYINWLNLEKQKFLKCDFLDAPLEIKIKEAVSLPNCTINENLQINIDNAKMKKYIEENIKNAVEIKPQNVKIYYDENEQIIFDGTGTNGQEISNKMLVNMLSLALSNGIQKFEIPLKNIPAQVETDEKLQTLGIKELTAVGWSDFSGSSNARIFNVKFGLEKYNGLLIAPGEKFSFNDHLGGPVTNESGWKSELVIKGNETIPEAGGGLCQVSTTFYRAAWTGGYKIDERSGHSYAVSYYKEPYGYGTDCTVYPGAKNCQFTNDSDYHILTQTYIEGTKAYFKFYSTNDGRKVDLDGPYYYDYHSVGPVYTKVDNLASGEKRLKEYSHTGFKADWYRFITKNGETEKELFHTDYRAMPAKYEVSAEDAVLSDFE